MARFSLFVALLTNDVGRVVDMGVFVDSGDVVDSGASYGSGACAGVGSESLVAVLTGREGCTWASQGSFRANLGFSAMLRVLLEATT